LFPGATGGPETFTTITAPDAIEGRDRVKIVVTGGAGFIGGNLCRALAEQDVGEVVAVDNLASGFRSNLEGIAGVELSVADILAPDDLALAFARANCVVHLAARPSVPRSIADPLATHAANATGTINVLEAARHAGAQHVIVASSSSVYGSNPALPKHEDLKPSPVSPYGVSKLAAEAYTLAWQECFGLPTLAFRFFNVFGPLQAADHAYAAVVPRFIAAALDGRPLTVYGDGTQTRDFTFVGSVVAVLIDAIRRHVAHPEPVNLAFGARRSLLDVVQDLQAIVGGPLDLDLQPPRTGDIAHSVADGSRLHSLFPDAEAVPFPEGLARTVDWFKATAR
jgi:UDP-glucose 4-epimerase